MKKENTMFSNHAAESVGLRRDQATNREQMATKGLSNGLTTLAEFTYPETVPGRFLGT